MMNKLRMVARSTRSNRHRYRRLVVECLEYRNLMAAWINQGPFSANNGQVEGITNRPVSGAIHTVLAHPTDANILYAGSVNGGVWKTTNATAPSPNWLTTMDDQSSLSIGAMTFDQGDPLFQTVWAGNGRYGSFGQRGGARDGLLKTTDGAATWTRVTGGGVLLGKNISGIAVNGDNIVVSVNVANTTSNANVGIFRSTNGGATFSQVNNAASSNGLPFGRSFDLVFDPLNPAVLYTSLGLAATAGNEGVYKSIDAGANWNRISNSAINTLFASNTSNAELAAGRFGEVYISVINSGVPAGLYRSPDGGVNWAMMDLPKTNEGGTDVGLNPGGPKGPLEGSPDEIAGGQGSIHFSMVTDPTDGDIVYVGGDRQPRSNGDTGGFPNSIGAQNFTGRLFRGDASRPLGSQFVHLTHNSALGPAGGGTASNSAPHADSREMVFDANFNLIEVDDGGIYRRTSPRSDLGDWFSVNGNIAVTEFHDIAYDRVSNTILGGTQDNGNASQNTAGAAIWNIVSQGDGGDVAVDEVTLASSNQTIRYTSAQNLGNLRRRTYNAAGAQVSVATPALTILGGGADITPAFRTPLQLNSITPSRLIIQGTNSVYESLDQANTLTEIAPGRGVGGVGSEQDAIVYGGFLDGVANPNVLWVGSQSTVLFRSAAGALSPTSSQPVTATIRDIVTDSANYNSAALLTSNSVRWTTNAGSSWSNITGNLINLTTDFRSLTFVPGVIGTILAGTARGVFAMSLAELGVWSKLATNLPNVLVYEMDYDAVDNFLVAGTLGRGAWSLSNVRSEIDTLLPPYDFGDAPNSYLVTSSSNGARHARVGPTLGNLRDAEVDGFPSATALGDNQVGLVDEDGVNFVTSAIPGFPLRMNVLAPQGGVLNAWLDTNLDGVFQPTERIFEDKQLSIGTNDIDATVPSSALSGESFVRFRITSSSGMVNSPFGAASDGEVEDYSLTVLPPATFEISANIIPENSPLDTTIGTFSTSTIGTTTPYTYTFVNGLGSDNNSSFTISGDQLRTKVPLDFETQTSYSIRVRSVDQASFLADQIFSITISNIFEAGVLARKLFYNRSTSPVFGDGSGNPTPAIDDTRQALLPGQTASIQNYSNYVRGINGLIVDVANLFKTPTSTDIQFATWDGINTDGFLPIAFVPTITMLTNAGSSGSTRLKIEFDDQVIKNTWLRITLLANPNTDLPANDVFYFGNSLGDVYNGNVSNPDLVRVNSSDVSILRQNQSQAPNSVPIDNIHDLNKDGRVNASDTSIARQNQQAASIQFFVAPISVSSANAYFTELGRKNEHEMIAALASIAYDESRLRTLRLR